MNEALFKNIISQFDFEINNILEDFNVNSCNKSLSDYFELQGKLDDLIRQRGDSVRYAKKQMGINK